MKKKLLLLVIIILCVGKVNFSFKDVEVYGDRDKPTATIVPGVI